MLVTSQDVENYKQIKSDLDQLRSIVEKSELWVYKRQGPDESIDVGEGLSTEPEHKKVYYTSKEQDIRRCKIDDACIIYSEELFSHTLLLVYFIG